MPRKIVPFPSRTAVADMSAEQAEAFRQYNQQWYSRSTAEYRARRLQQNHARRTANKAWLSEEKRNRGCAVCGERDASVLDWHHTSEKSFALGTSKTLYKSRAVIQREIMKCIVLCANCHRRRHAAGKKSHAAS